jgi:hypothetical protein
VSLAALRFTHANALAELLLWVAGIVLVFAGFLLGQPIRRLWARKDSVFETVDQIESGKIDIEDKLRDEGGKLRGFLRSLFGRGGKPASPPPEAEPRRIEEKAPPVQEIPGETEAREMVERFVNRRKGGDA